MPIICETCKGEIKHKNPLQKEGKYFCCSHCLALYEKPLSFRDLSSLSNFASAYIYMCRLCPFTLKKVCWENVKVQGGFVSDLRQYQNFRDWCCHAEFNLSTCLTDGTVPMETAKKALYMAEKVTIDRGQKIVTTANLQIAFVELFKNLEYTKIETPSDFKIPPPPRMDHFTACATCYKEFEEQCLKQSAESFPYAYQTKTYIMKTWCEHSIHAISQTMLNKKFTPDLAKKLVKLTEKVSEEKQHPGVIVRDLYIAIGRAIQ